MVMHLGLSTLKCTSCMTSFLEPASRSACMEAASVR